MAQEEALDNQAHRNGKEFFFIRNPASGHGRIGEVLEQTCGRLEHAGHSAVIQTTDGAGHATRIVSEIPDGAAGVIAVGGDGTVREVAQGLTGRQIPLAILPLGTENLVAKHFGYTACAASLLSTLLAGQRRWIDIGTMNRNRFLVVAGVGFDAEVVHRLTQVRQGHITRKSYFAPIWETFWHHRFPHLQVEADNSQVYSGPGLALIGNLPRYGAGLRILNEARCADGKLDVCVFPCMNRFQLLGHAARALLRMHRRWGSARYLKADHIRISSEAPTPVQLDGDPGGALPATFSIEPQALLILAPSGRRREAV